MEIISKELLSLVLDDINMSSNIEITVDKHRPYVRYPFIMPKGIKVYPETKALNLDTLTRLMIDFMFDNGHDSYCGKRHNMGAIEHYCIINGKSEGTYGTSIFEAVTKATHWVAKEKGLL